MLKDGAGKNNGRSCDVTGGGDGSATASGSSGGDPSCYNSDAEFGLTDDSNVATCGKQVSSSIASGNAPSSSGLNFKENQRLKVAKELLDTERKYCHTLKTIQETFALPLKTSGVLSMKDINTLFPEEVFKLYEKHCGLLSQLEERVGSWKTQPTVGDLLERFINGDDANVLRLYTSYVNDFPEVLKTFHKLCRSSTEFTRFLKSTLEHPTCGGLDLGAFLLTPVQRMPRYILLLKQMMKFTDMSHPDYKNISICLDRLREYLKRLNDSMEHSFQLVTAQISPQPHEPLLEKLIGFSGKNHFPRASTSSQSSTGGEQDRPHHQSIVHKVRYKRSTSVPRSGHSSNSDHTQAGPKSMPTGSNNGNPQKDGKSKLKSRSKSDWAVCNNVNKGSIANAGENEGGAGKRCTSCNCASQQTSKGHDGGDVGVLTKMSSRVKSKKPGIFERTLSDSDINSDGDEGSLEDQKETATRKFSTSKSLHDFNQDDDDIDAGNLEWFISEPSLCEMKHSSSSSGTHRHDAIVTPDEDDSAHLSRTSSSPRRNMMIRPMTSHPSGRVVARLTRSSESEMNLHMLEKANDKDVKASKSKGKMSLRNSLKNIFSIKKRNNRALQISHPIPPNPSEGSNCSTTSIFNELSQSSMSFKPMPQMIEHRHHVHSHVRHSSQDHQSMPTEPLVAVHSTSYPAGGSISVTPCGGRDVIESKTSMSLPYVPSTSSTTSMASSSSGGGVMIPTSSSHHRYVKNKLAQPKLPRTAFVKKHSAHTTSGCNTSDAHL